MLSMHQENTGEFREKQFRKWFTYRPTDDTWANKHGLTHEIDVADGTRFAVVKKTVAIVAIDEADDGTPITEKWSLAQNRAYLKQS